MNGDIINAGTSRRCGISCDMGYDINVQLFHERRITAAEYSVPQKMRR